jgi:hypothetical protein
MLLVNDFQRRRVVSVGFAVTCDGALTLAA